MLVLSRKLNESIVIDGRIVVKVVRVDGDVVKLGIEAPRNVPVHRQEIYAEIQRSNEEALASARQNAGLPKLPPAPLASPEKSSPPPAPPASPV